MGVTDVEVYAADGTSAIVRGQQTRDELLTPYLSVIKE